MLKKLQKKQISILVGAGLCAFLAGAMFSAPEIGKTLGKLLRFNQTPTERITEETKAKSIVFPLVTEPVEARAAKLTQIANNTANLSGFQQLERSRARYLLASDLLANEKTQKQNAQQILKLLDGLEHDYSLLAPYVLLQRARVYDITGNPGKASDLRQQVVREYPKHPAVVKAYYLISTPEYQERAIAEFPSHPLTWEIMRKRLAENFEQPQLKLNLARYAFNQPGIGDILSNLSTDANLKPEDWEVIGNARWENKQFGSAATAYSKAPKTPRNLYRIGRGLQISGDREPAFTAYQDLINQFPQSSEAGIGLLRMAELVPSNQDALPLLEQIISKYPEQAPEALVRKANILKQQKDQKGAAAAYKLLLEKYANSEQAAVYRWEQAQNQAKAKNYQAAWEWAQPIPTNNPSSILAPRAGFWVGKWATKLGKNTEAKQAYEYTLGEFPFSYYAWRSAVALGLKVGDFNNLRQMNPDLVKRQRPVPLAGSESFKELYLLGQDRDAWLQWESEFTNKTQPTIGEQFTEGLMQLVRNENLKGINTVSTLEDREAPADKAEYQQLRQQITYWQARYPFPYLDLIEKWAATYKVNPVMVTALIRQESRFEAKAKSTAGATGLMQVMPDTAKWIAPQIGKDIKNINLEDPEDNIMLGSWYLGHTHDTYKNNSLLAIASYNAGPGNVSRWLQQPNIPKDDPDEFVEAIPFNETKNYVRQVFGNYWNYLRLYNPEISNLVAKYSTNHPTLTKQQPQSTTTPTTNQSPVESK